MKETLANQILNSIMTSDDDWLCDSPVQPIPQLDTDFFQEEFDLVDRLPIFISPAEVDNSQFVGEYTDLTSVASYDVTTSIDINSTSTFDPESTVDLESTLAETDSSIDVDSTTSWDGSEVFTCSSSNLLYSAGDVKQELKLRIKSKRMASGQEDITVDFLPPEPEQLTEEEARQRDEKKEKNRLAAQKCRNKKRERAEVLENDIARLQTKQCKLKEAVEKLKDEKEKLEQIIEVHGSVCNKMRRLSKS